MGKLANLLSQEEIFSGGITPNWKYALDNGFTKLYDNAILNYYVKDNICVINSGSIEDSTFPKSMLKDIKTLILTHKSVIISSNVASIGNYLKKHNFSYNAENRCYMKGILLNTKG